MESQSATEIQKQKFGVRIFLFKNNDKRVVEVKKAEVINLDELKERLERGESILIVPDLKHRRKLDQEGSRIAPKEPWYFTHI